MTLERLRELEKAAAWRELSIALDGQAMHVRALLGSVPPGGRGFGAAIAELSQTLDRLARRADEEADEA